MSSNTTLVNYCLHPETGVERFCTNYDQCEQSFGGDDPKQWFICTGCRAAAFCSSACQTAVWKLHKKVCLASQAAVLETERFFSSSELKEISFREADVEVFSEMICPLLQTLGRSALRVGRKDSVRTSHVILLYFDWKPPSKVPVNYKDRDTLLKRFTFLRGQVVHHQNNPQYSGLLAEGSRRQDTMSTAIYIKTDGVRYHPLSMQQQYFVPTYFTHMMKFRPQEEPEFDHHWDENLNRRLKNYDTTLSKDRFVTNLFLEDVYIPNGKEYLDELLAWMKEQGGMLAE